MKPEIRAKYHELLDDACDRGVKVHKLHTSEGVLVGFALVVVPKDLPNEGRVELAAGIARELCPHLSSLPEDS